MEEATGLDFTESVYNLLYKTHEECDVSQPTKPRVSRYKSVYSARVKEEEKKQKASHRTMGLPEEPLPQPQCFLKKHSKELKLDEISLPGRTSKEKDHPCIKSMPVPKRVEMKEMIKTDESKKDFISLNVSAASLMQSTKPVVKQIDSRKGNSFALPSSGLQPLFLHKKDYGKVPVYIEQRKKDLEDQQKQYEAYVDDRVQQGSIKQIPEDERVTMIEGLKSNWDELFRMYQKMSLTIDTFGKRQRKIQLEAEMKQLEKDISLLEGYPTIYLLQ